MPHNRMHRVAHLSLLVGTMLAANAADAVAQQPTQAQTNAIRQSCRSDYQAHCASVPTGGSAALQCLQQNMPGLSPSCQSAVSAVGGGSSTPTASAPAAPAPAPAQGSMPPSPPPPPMTMRQQAALMRNACGGDFRAYCSGVRLGGGRAAQCLADHRESLSPTCQNALSAAGGR
jgi:Cysteine rich repeat